MMPNDPVVGGSILRRPAIQSPNFQTGVSGWSINADGTAEFQSLTARGNISATSITNTPIGSSQISNSDFHDGTIERTIITLDNSGGLILVYATTVTTVILTTGTTWVSPANTPATGLVECWAGAAGGVFGSSGKGAAGGAAEYAAEGAYPLIANNTYTIQIGQGGQGGTSVLFVASGTATFFDNGGVIANPGLKGNLAVGGLGGQGSPNSVHFPGGNGGQGFSAPGALDAGGGGGASGGPHGSGNNGGDGTNAQGGLGGVASAGAGNGGNGGRGAAAGANGVFPGGGAGGGGSAVNGTSPTNGGAGANGKIQITYQTSRTLIGSIAPVAGSDQFANPFPVGFMTNQLTLQNQAATPTPQASTLVTWSDAAGYPRFKSGDANDQTAYFVGVSNQFNTSAQTISSTVAVQVTPMQFPVGVGTYYFQGIIRLKQGAVNVTQQIGLSGPAVSQTVWYQHTSQQAGTNGITFVQGALATVAVAFVAANDEDYWYFEGTATFTSAGTLSVMAAEGTVGDSFTVQPGSFMNVRPVR